MCSEVVILLQVDRHILQRWLPHFCKFSLRTRQKVSRGLYIPFCDSEFSIALHLKQGTTEAVGRSCLSPSRHKTALRSRNNYWMAHLHWRVLKIQFQTLLFWIQCVSFILLGTKRLVCCVVFMYPDWWHYVISPGTFCNHCRFLSYPQLRIPYGANI